MFGDARLPERFWKKVRINHETGCWEWIAGKSDGYGSFGVGGNRQKHAHRVTYETLVGPVPKGLDCDHLCRVRHCCNPAHIEPVSRSVNCKRSPLMGKWKTATTHCPKGHEYDAGNTYTDKRGKRNCRACCRIAEQAYRARHRAS